jgi:3',5'-cyclic AMP phosphodiesterase CpdA
VDFVVGEVLTNPTDRSIEIALLPGEDVELYAAYREISEGPARRSPQIRAAARELAVLRLGELLPDREYEYAVWVRRTGDEEFTARPGATFRTLRRQAGSVFRFAYTADSHIVGRWIKVACSLGADQKRALENFGATLENILRADVDFTIAGGDNFMVHAPRMETCEGFEQYGSGTVRSSREADLRYEAALSPALWGRLTAHVPFLYVLGNHDGEARFGDAGGSFGHFTDTRELSRAARLRHLPDPTSVYIDGAGGANRDLYFSFTSGDARLIVLDVMSGPRDYPARAQDWTLGREQLAWLERVLRQNDRTWTLVFAEHLVGGTMSTENLHAERDRVYHYGRGGLRSTQDGTPRAPFLGEQAALHSLMREQGVDVFFHAHDHVAVVGEKPDAEGRGEGVFYVLGGQASGDGTGPAWQHQTWFREWMDYDANGEADFLTGVTGSLAPGFYLVTVTGRERLDLAYVASDASDAAANGRAVFQLSLFPDGTSKWIGIREDARRAHSVEGQ